MALTNTSIQKLTDADRKELERKCGSKLNWSDGGNWIGRGKEPNCFQNEIVQNKLSHTVHFKTDEAATRWNLEWEKTIRYAGHLGTAALTVGVTLATTGSAGVALPILVGFGAAVAKDELQAKIPYPRMARGWSYQVTFNNKLHWSPHPWGQKQFTQRVVVTIRDNEKKEVSTITKTIQFSLDEIPHNVARKIAKAPSKATVSYYE